MPYLIESKGEIDLETPGKTGPEPGVEPVDIFKGTRRDLFYPQVAQRLCISHTEALWTATAGTRESLAIRSPNPWAVPQISRNQRPHMARNS